MAKYLFSKKDRLLLLALVASLVALWTFLILNKWGSEFGFLLVGVTGSAVLIMCAFAKKLYLTTSLFFPYALAFSIAAIDLVRYVFFKDLSLSVGSLAHIFILAILNFVFSFLLYISIRKGKHKAECELILKGCAVETCG